MNLEVDDYLKVLARPGSILPGYTLATFQKGAARLPAIHKSRNLTALLKSPDSDPKMVKLYLQAPCLDQLRRRLSCVHKAVSRLHKSLPAIVPFDYRPAGIRVGGVDWPVLVMPRIEGGTLESFLRVGFALGSDSRERYQQLALKLYQLFRDFEEAGIGHQDLDIFNILVEGREDRLRVVDFDGLFAPETQALGPKEKGKPNFTSPARREHWGGYVDRFTHWTLFVSVLALSLDPELKLLMTPDAFLFRKEDYQGTGTRLAALETSKSRAVRNLAGLLKSVWEAPLDSRFPVLTAPRSFKERAVRAWARSAFRPSDLTAPTSLVGQPSPQPTPVANWWLDPHRTPRRRDVQTTGASRAPVEWWMREFGAGVYDR